jgi:hypothetical protein
MTALVASFGALKHIAGLGAIAARYCRKATASYSSTSEAFSNAPDEGLAQIVCAAAGAIVGLVLVGWRSAHHGTGNFECSDTR